MRSEKGHFLFHAVHMYIVYRLPSQIAHRFFLLHGMQNVIFRSIKILNSFQRSKRQGHKAENFLANIESLIFVLRLNTSLTRRHWQSNVFFANQHFCARSAINVF